MPLSKVLFDWKSPESIPTKLNSSILALLLFLGTFGFGVGIVFSIHDSRGWKHDMERTLAAAQFPSSAFYETSYGAWLRSDEFSGTEDLRQWLTEKNGCHTHTCFLFYGDQSDSAITNANRFLSTIRFPPKATDLEAEKIVLMKFVNSQWGVQNYSVFPLRQILVHLAVFFFPFVLWRGLSFWAGWVFKS